MARVPAAADVSTSPEADGREPLYRLKDLVNAARKRTVSHDLAGVPVEFVLGIAPSPVPWEQASCVAGSPDFEVVDENGLIVQVADRLKGADGDVHLLTNQVIAEYAELKDASLRRRALRLPGGDKFRAGGTREDMIAFLLEYRSREVEVKRKAEESRGKAVGGRRDGSGALVMFADEESTGAARAA